MNGAQAAEAAASYVAHDTSLKRGVNKNGHSAAADSFCACCLAGVGRTAAARCDAFLRRKYASRRLRLIRTRCCCPMEFLSVENRRNAIAFEPTLEVSQLGEFGRHAAALHFEPRPYVDTTTANWNSSRPYKPRRGSQVVRSRSAKPLFAGSIPAPAFLKR